MSWSDERLSILRLAAVAILSSLVAACGFHLRGDVAYPFSTLYINAPANMPFATELKRTLAGSSTLKLADSAAAAEVILDLPSVTDDKQVLSLSGGGRAREYALTKRLTFALHDTSGKDWLPAAEIVVRRSYTFNESEVLARESEEAKLFKEMQTDAVQQVIRRLQSAKKPA
jgi:LPS-assembly lipoprotein